MSNIRGQGPAAPMLPHSPGRSGQLGYPGNVNTVRRHLKPYRNGAIPATAPLPRLTVRKVTDWTMRRPECLTDVERKGLDELCERNSALATTAEYARRLTLMVRDRRSEHLALDVWIADVRLDGQRELQTLANGMRRDRAAVQAALTTTYTSGAVEGNVTRFKRVCRTFRHQPRSRPQPPIP
ncbi:transposase [Streptomyces sp. NPDC051840]|uniref:transposase n=1 Tax=Streptomyces sp. NPDC051840 TaxID=3154752 RepID=UPI00341663FC